MDMIKNLKEIKKIKNRQGSALAFTLIILLVLSIITTSVLFVFNSNLRQAKHQQDSLEAYYLAYSGAEMAYTALLTEVSSNKFKLNELNGGNELAQSNIDFGNGKINISAKISDEENFDGWVEIKSTGILNKNNQSYTRSLFFDPENPINRVWRNN